ncbi:NAD(P)-binding protein [Wolfiporia cocos MD-104 SS10]|uniref:NAD(P)-binding protein n=1 Tax=Wolfiporia cocos (strain MD-104) TaxID=742152 RepID=A0A2H3JJ25_WOLCO|nr:NAD(P)-binding protein [Wolfiporia cocos MD-104 SS10]
MAPSSYTRLVLAERPTGLITESTFRKEVVPYDLKADNKQVIVQVDYVSLDPGSRIWLDEATTYVEPVQIGETMRLFAIGTVVEAGEGSGFRAGDLVSGLLGWTEYVVIDGGSVAKVKVPEGATFVDFLGPLGHTGLTAYFGLLEVGKLQPGEKLLVSAATGSIVCQIAKSRGAKVYAIAGTPEKCAWLENDLGVDKALNYKSPTFQEDFINSVDRFDVFFDNVGGEILDFALTRLNVNARVVLCGALSEYNARRSMGLTNYIKLLEQRAKIEGFIVSDYTEQFPEVLEYLSRLLLSGSLKRNYHIVEGLEQAPKAFNLLFSGHNTGKLLAKVLRRKNNNLRLLAFLISQPMCLGSFMAHYFEC